MTTYADASGTMTAYVRLTAAHGTFDVDRPLWGHLQLLALVHGWEPAGTLGGEDGQLVELGYEYNFAGGQLARGEDAAAMAAALERARPSLIWLEEDAIEPNLEALTWPEVMTDDPPSPPQQREAFQAWSLPVRRRRLDEFIAFCRRGTGFRVSSLFVTEEGQREVILSPNGSVVVIPR